MSTLTVKSLPTTGVQFRTVSGGTGSPAATAYLQAVRGLHAWAKSAAQSPLVHALVHLGWTSGSGARSVCKAANSAAFKHGQAHLAVGEPAGPQVVEVLKALQAAGAPAELLDTVWGTFTGK